MSLSTNLVSGLVSGFDWRSMIDQLIAIEHERVDLIEDRKTEYESKLSEWQSVNTMLLSLKTAADALSTETAFNVYTASTTSNTSTSASNLLTVSTSSSASPAMYNIVVNNLAQSEKISSQSYAATDTALSTAHGSSFYGDILINGNVVNIVSTDTLADIKDKINAVNIGSDPSGVTASIVSHSSTNHHLILTSDETGEDGLSVQEADYNGGADILETMGFISSTTTIKNTTSDGAKSDLFTSSDGVVKTLLNLSDPASGAVTIGGQSVTIDLANESITTIAQNIDAEPGISASVVSETVDGETQYRIDISGTTDFSDTNNILQTLGILKGTYGSVSEVHEGSALYTMKAGDVGNPISGTTLFSEIFTGSLRGDVKNTEDGSTPISSSTTWSNINGFTWTGDEIITVSGKDHDDVGVSDTYLLAGRETETLSGFLGWVEDLYGDSTTVDAYIDSTGRLVVEDLQSGSSYMSVTVSCSDTDLKFNATPANPFGNDISDTGTDTISISGTRGDGSTVSLTYTITDKSVNTIGNLLNYIRDGEEPTPDDDGFDETSRTATLSVSTDGKITITDDTAGDSQLSLTLIANNDDGGTLDFGAISMATEGRSMQVAAGEDAEIVVDNVTITNSSNTITDIIAGATLNLVGEDTDTTVTLKVDRDLATIKSKITDMVNAYNSIMEYINTQFSYDDETEETGGILFGDGTLSSVKSELIDMVTETVTGASSDFNKLALIGITLDLTNTEEGKYQDLTLTIDDDDLTDALEANFNDVRSLFIAYGSSPSSNIEYIGHTDDTVGGTYDVVISQEATRTTYTGGSALAATLGEDFTMTINDYNISREANVTLTTDMDIDDVVNAINSELAEEKTEVLTGVNNTGKTSSTLFKDITGADNNDVITFSGTRQNGLSVSGSYTISDKETETVGDLLESIEDMFEDEVTVAISGGKIVITDTQAGDSQLSFYIDTSAIGEDLDFGDVSTTTEGRYAITITASEDSNTLFLTHNTYGTGHIIQISHDGTSDLLGLDSATQVYGKDVAGTINSVAATGSGQRLTLDSDGNNADGLSISYKGTSTTTTTFTLTLGIAELLDRQLGFITDTTDGYVAYKKTSLQNSIDRFETRIEDMEAQLNLKMERMINKFVAMEVALSRIQNQSDWLSGQINASFSGWGSF